MPTREEVLKIQCFVAIGNDLRECTGEREREGGRKGGRARGREGGRTEGDRKEGGRQGVTEGWREEVPVVCVSAQQG